MSSFNSVGEIAFFLLLGVTTFFPHELPTFAQSPHKLPTRPK